MDLYSAEQFLALLVSRFYWVKPYPCRNRYGFHMLAEKDFLVFIRTNICLTFLWDCSCASKLKRIQWCLVSGQTPQNSEVPLLPLRRVVVEVNGVWCFFFLQGELKEKKMCIFIKTDHFKTDPVCRYTGSCP